MRVAANAVDIAYYKQSGLFINTKIQGERAGRNYSTQKPTIIATKAYYRTNRASTI